MARRRLAGLSSTTGEHVGGAGAGYDGGGHGGDEHGDGDDGYNSIRAALYGPKPEYTELDLDDKDCVNGNWRCYYKWLSENTPDQCPAIKTSKYLASHGARLHLIMRLMGNSKGGQIRGCQCMKRAPPSPASPHR